MTLYDEIMACSPCNDYPAGRVASIVAALPEPTLTALLRCKDVPAQDRLWVGWRLAPVVAAEAATMTIVDRAIRHSLGTSGCPAWEAWATRWLSGEDRTAGAAKDAEMAAAAVAETVAGDADAAAGEGMSTGDAATREDAWDAAWGARAAAGATAWAAWAVEMAAAGDIAAETWERAAEMTTEMAEAGERSQQCEDLAEECEKETNR